MKKQQPNQTNSNPQRNSQVYSKWGSDVMKTMTGEAGNSETDNGTSLKLSVFILIFLFFQFLVLMALAMKVLMA